MVTGMVSAMESLMIKSMNGIGREGLVVRTRMSSKSISILCVWTLFSSKMRIYIYIYISLFLLAIVPYLWWHKCLFCNTFRLIQCRLLMGSQTVFLLICNRSGYWMLSLWLLFHCPCRVWVDDGIWYVHLDNGIYLAYQFYLSKLFLICF